MALTADQFLNIMKENHGDIDLGEYGITTIPDGIYEIPGVLTVDDRVPFIPGIKVGQLVLTLRYDKKVEIGNCFKANKIVIMGENAFGNQSVHIGMGLSVAYDLVVGCINELVVGQDADIGQELIFKQDVSVARFGRNLRVGRNIVETGVSRLELSESSFIGYDLDPTSERLPVLKYITNIPPRSIIRADLRPRVDELTIGQFAIIEGEVRWDDQFLHLRDEDSYLRKKLPPQLHLGNNVTIGGRLHFRIYNNQLLQLPDNLRLGQLKIDGEGELRFGKNCQIGPSSSESSTVRLGPEVRLTDLSSGLRVEGDFTCLNAYNLSAIDPTTRFAGSITLNGLDISIWPFRHNMGDLVLRDSSIKSFYPGTFIDGVLVLSGSRDLRSLEGVTTYRLEIVDCPNLGPAQAYCTGLHQLLIGGSTNHECLKVYLQDDVGFDLAEIKYSL